MRSSNQLNNIMDLRLIELSDLIDQYETMLSYALEAAEIGIWEWNVKEDRLKWDARMFEVYGVDKEEFTHDSAFLRLLVHPEDQAGLHEAIQNSTKTKNNFKYTFRARRDDNKLIIITTKGKPILDKNGDLIKMIGVCYRESECPKFLDCKVKQELAKS